MFVSLGPDHWLHYALVQQQKFEYGLYLKTIYELCLPTKLHNYYCFNFYLKQTLC